MLAGSCPGGTKFLSMCEPAHTSAVSMAAIVDSWDAIPHSVAVQRPALEIAQLRSSWRRWRISPWSAFEIKNRLLPQPTAPGDLEGMIEGAAISEYIAIGGFKNGALQGSVKSNSMENAPP